MTKLHDQGNTHRQIFEIPYQYPLILLGIIAITYIFLFYYCFRLVIDKFCFNTYLLLVKKNTYLL